MRFSVDQRVWDKYGANYPNGTEIPDKERFRARVFPAAIKEGLGYDPENFDWDKEVEIGNIMRNMFRKLRTNCGPLGIKQTIKIYLQSFVQLKALKMN